MKTILDTITPGALKGTPINDIYAGYVGGRWADYNTIRQDYPGHMFMSYAVAPGELADFADCEAGDFKVDQIVPWIKWAHSRGVWRPGAYGSLDTFENGGLLHALETQLPRAMYRTIVADFDDQPNIPWSWADGKQYIDHGPHGENYDMTVVRDDFFPSHVPPVQRVAASRLTVDVLFDTRRLGWTTGPVKVQPLPWNAA